MGEVVFPEWRFCQVFGDNTPLEDVQEEDVITQIKFSRDGDYLAAGDIGGRIVVFQRSHRDREREREKQTKSKKRVTAEYSFHTEFQSHEPQFDSLRSIEIDQRINDIAWLKP
ncbi:protein phosphatase 2A regulatory subunit PR55, partial [Kipferlia bialata]|eukprot:g8201.t1